MHRLRKLSLQLPHLSVFSLIKRVFRDALKKIGRIGDVNSPKTKSYIVKTIKNSAIDIYRKNKRNYNRIQPIDDSTFSIPDTALEFENNMGGNDGILEKLNETDRKIITLRCRDELQWRDIAQRMNMTESNVRIKFGQYRTGFVRRCPYGYSLR